MRRSEFGTRVSLVRVQTPFASLCVVCVRKLGGFVQRTLVTTRKALPGGTIHVVQVRMFRDRRTSLRVCTPLQSRVYISPFLHAFRGRLALLACYFDRFG